MSDNFRPFESSPGQTPAAGQTPTGYQPPGAQQPWQAPVGESAFVDLSQPGEEAPPATTMSTVSNSKGLRAGLIGAVVMVAGAGGFAVNSALTEAAGAESPEAAVSAFFDAVENDDYLGMAETLLPSERESLVEPSLDMLEHLQRLDVIAEFESGDIAAIDIEIDGLEVGLETAHEGVVIATTTGGTVTTTTDPGSAPIGEIFTDRWPEVGAELDGTQREVSVEQLADSPVRMAVVEEDGSWYISVWYTVAENFSNVLGEDPTFAGPAANGAATPEAAVEGMIRDLVAFDADAAFGRLDPEEFQALYDYSNLFLPEVREGFASAEAELADEGNITINSLTARSFDSNGRTVVTIDSFDASMTGPNDTVQVAFDGECFTFTSTFDGVVETETACQDDLDDEWMSGTDFAIIDKLSELETGVTVVERDGEWFISGMPTLLGMPNDVLAALDRDDIEQLIDTADDFVNNGFWFGELADAFDIGSFGPSAADKFEAIDSSISGDLAIDSGEGSDLTIDDGEVSDLTSEDAWADLYPTDPSHFPEGTEVTGYDPKYAFIDINQNLPTAVAYAIVWDENAFVDVLEYDSIEAAAEAYGLLDASLVDSDTQESLGYPVKANDSSYAILVDRWIVSGFVEFPDQDVRVAQIEVLAAQP